MERFVGGARVTGGARRQLSVGALGVGRRSVASVGLGRPQRTRGSLQQARGTLSSGELEKPERPNVTERPVPEPIVPEQTIETLDTLDTLDTLETLEPQVDAEETRENLAHARECMEAEKKVSIQVLRLNKAGLVCRFSDTLECFVPVAQLSSYTRQFYREEWIGFGNDPSVVREKKEKRGRTLVGETIDCCVIAVRDQDEEGFGQKHLVVMSEKKVEDLGRSEVFDVTERGDVVECYVKTVTHFGIFVKLGAIDALIHKSQVWLPEMEEQGEDITIDEAKLSANFSLGDRLQAVVIKADREKGQISLSMKALVPDRSKLSLSEIAQEMKKITTKNEDWVIPEMVKMCSTLDEMDEIEEIIPGPCIKSGAVAPEFQVLLSSKDHVDGGYEVFARKGFQVQEARVKTALGRVQLKTLLQNVSSKVV